MTNCEKGIAAVFIMLHHLSQKLLVQGPFIVMQYIGFILVAVFFFISGYGLKYALYNKDNYLKSFFKKRLLAVFEPYWIVLLITIIVYAFCGKIFTVRDYMLSFIGCDIITGTWFVTAIVVIYFLFWFSYAVTGKEHGDFAMLLLLIGYCIVCRAINVHSSYTASIAAFYLGIIWEKYAVVIIPWIRKSYVIKLIISILVCVVLFFGRLFLAFRYIDNELMHTILRNIISIAFIFMMITVTQKVQFKGLILDFLGSISYELYMVHYVLLCIGSRVDNNNLYVMIVIVGGILLSTLLKMCFRKSPLTTSS